MKDAAILPDQKQIMPLIQEVGEKDEALGNVLRRLGSRNSFTEIYNAINLRSPRPTLQLSVPWIRPGAA